MHVCLALELLAQEPKLRNLALADSQGFFGLQINSARVFLVQFIQFGANLPPDASFLGRVINQGWTKAFEPMAAAECEKLLAALDITFVAQARVAWFQLQF